MNFYTPGQIKDWPGTPLAPNERQRSQFKSTPFATLHDLRSELGRIGAQDVRLLGYWQDKDFRRDGTVKAEARPTSPGVIVEYEVDGELYRFACDTYGFWEHNLKAIVKTLENLRAIDRYGVVKGEQYVGFKALPEKASESMTHSAALDILSIESGMSRAMIEHDNEQLRRAIRVARSKSHPDAATGSRSAWDRVSAAAELLGFHT